MNFSSNLWVRKIQNYLLVRRAKKIILSNPESYAHDMRKVGIDSVEQHGGNIHYKLTYNLKDKPDISFKYEKDNSLKSLVVKTQGVILSLNARSASRIAGYLKYYHGGFRRDSGGGSTFTM